MVGCSVNPLGSSLWWRTSSCGWFVYSYGLLPSPNLTYKTDKVDRLYAFREDYSSLKIVMGHLSSRERSFYALGQSGPACFLGGYWWLWRSVVFIQSKGEILSRHRVVFLPTSKTKILGHGPPVFGRVFTDIHFPASFFLTLSQE